MNVDKENCQNDCSLAAGTPRDPNFQNGVATPNLGGITVQPLGPASDPRLAQSDLTKTWNFLIPADMANGDLLVNVRVNAGNYNGFIAQPSLQECTIDIALQCARNNDLFLHLHFNQPNELDVNPVFVHVNGTWHGSAINDVQSDEASSDAIISNSTRCTRSASWPEIGKT